MISNYKKIKEYNKEANANDQIYSKLFSHPLSLFLVALLEKTNISPNVLTSISFFLTLVGTYTLLTIDGYSGLLITLAILHFALVFDSADGQLARWTKRGSLFGAYYDVFTDHISYRLLFISLTIRLSWENENAMLIGLLALAIHTLAGFQNLAINNIYLKNNLNNQKTEAAEQLFGKSKLKQLLGQMQNFLFAGYYLFLAITFVFNIPIYFLYTMGTISGLLILKRSVVFYFAVKGK